MSAYLDAVCNLTENAKDPFQRYILRKEILGQPDEAQIIDAIHASKWYRQLACEQWEDGSYGRFHTMDSSDPQKRCFKTTEAALRRMRDLALTKDDPLVSKSITLMEKYLRGEEAWRDAVEKHGDGGKSHLRSRHFFTCANLSTFDPSNCAIAPFRQACVRQLREAFASGGFEGEAWQRLNRSYEGTCLQPFMLHTIWLAQGEKALDPPLEREYLRYLWNREGGIYYISNRAVRQKPALEDGEFPSWLSALEALSGFSLFGEFLRRDIYGYLESVIRLLMEADDRLPPPSPIAGHYAESWRGKNARRNDMMLRILRILKKAGAPQASC